MIVAISIEVFSTTRRRWLAILAMRRYIAAVYAKTQRGICEDCQGFVVSNSQISIPVPLVSHFMSLCGTRARHTTSVDISQTVCNGFRGIS
jgi:hypothetical protein